MSYIDVNHFKINRANSGNISEEEYEVKKVSINPDFKELLIEMGYHEKRGLDEFILAPEETCTRKQLMRIVSDAFTHFYKMLNTGDVKNFKHLRKTYVTEMVVLLGKDAPAATKQRLDTIMKHYYAEARMMEVLHEHFKALGKIFDDKSVQPAVENEEGENKKEKKKKSVKKKKK